MAFRLALAVNPILFPCLYLRRIALFLRVGRYDISTIVLEMVDSESWIYQSGDIFLPKEVRKILETYWIGGPKTIFYVTNWTFMHMLSGVLTAHSISVWFPKAPLFWTGFVLHTLWELWQMTIGMTKFKSLRGQVDVVVDTISFLIGMYLYILFGKK